MKTARSATVPKPMQAMFDAVAALTDAVCRDHLTAEYGELARTMAAALARKRPSPLSSGQPRTWACGIVYVLGQLNFLSDPASQPCMTTADLCKAFGVGQSTASAKARVIGDALQPNRMDVKWMLKGLAEQNPLLWMVELDGMIVDIRHLPREIQVAAFESGIIPRLPSDAVEEGAP